MTNTSKTILKNMWSARRRLVSDVNLPNFGLKEAEHELYLLRQNSQEINRIENIRWSKDVASFVRFFILRIKTKYKAKLNVD
jgi:hypothetical protein